MSKVVTIFRILFVFLLISQKIVANSDNYVLLKGKNQLTENGIGYKFSTINSELLQENDNLKSVSKYSLRINNKTIDSLLTCTPSQSEILALISKSKKDTIIIWSSETCENDTSNLIFYMYYISHNIPQRIAIFYPNRICLACSLEDYIFNMMIVENKKQQIHIRFIDSVRCIADGETWQSSLNNEYYSYDKRTMKIKIHSR